MDAKCGDDKKLSARLDPVEQKAMLEATQLRKLLYATATAAFKP